MNKETYKKILLPFIVLLVLIQVWSGLATIVEDFPTPSDTYVYAFGGETADGDEIEGVLSDPFYIENQDDKGLFWQILASLERVFAGFVLAIIVGVPVGLLVGMSKNFQYAFEPFIQIFKPVSPLAWLPLLLFVFQDINATAISTIFITSIWPIIINTALGVKNVSEDYLNVAKVLQFTSLEKITKIILPVAVPYIFTGMRLSLGIAWLVIVAAEMLTGGIGIGFWIWDEYNNLSYHNIIIGIILVGLIGFILDVMMGKIADYFDYRKRT
ncbi:nitrate ABC transporter permease [Poseidonibacter ostreae]|jgi:nitrate/nitrite transport system permease protein|uniref:Nitrate ABC transporter permease n=1 Tax=Poseidonibacter ostreae TaxID=2654171 RepID=A0A6L4WTI6_9BACT|nr:nitrate ABC transporter permease [Poseidonibacter ostreae]KAB7885921.1 nitrate ABC transporter permease [Poseidonibacter ostreae]KAB7889398.1 nitrate ABC transporter permease [Poseidonibacter ostreae]KAB7891674.1 nitrate ABC transporter permease [Poseidonibacter ostreae]|tara:strand:- start:2960 stop:3769 length:810 start_codon:yes stop_codon:yes gene_type:complete